MGELRRRNLAITTPAYDRIEPGYRLERRMTIAVDEGRAHADSPPTLPTVTVIVPTYNRALPLADTLRALVAQDYPAHLLDIVVVDNSSSDNTEDVVRAIAAESSFPVRFYRKENRGPAVSRNFAIARSSGDILAFTDSDCTMEREWVRRGVAMMGPGVGLVSGPIKPVNHAERIPSFFAHQIDHETEDPIFATANVFYRRSIVVELGGFNEEYGTYPWGLPVGGEDTDLAWRVKRAGYASAFTGDAPVYHVATNLPVGAWLFEPFRSQIMPRLVRDFPELRSWLYGGLFLTQGSAFFTLALAGSAAAALRRNPLPVLLAVPWLWDLRGMVERDVRSPRRWWRIPFKYGLMTERYLMQTVALTMSSIAHRTPVL